MSEDTLTCRDFSKFLSDYLEGELPQEQSLVFDHHIGECPDCKAYLSTFRETIRLGKAVCQEEEAPAEISPELTAAILAALRR